MKDSGYVNSYISPNKKEYVHSSESEKEHQIIQSIHHDEQPFSEIFLTDLNGDGYLDLVKYSHIKSKNAFKGFNLYTYMGKEDGSFDDEDKGKRYTAARDGYYPCKKNNSAYAPPQSIFFVDMNNDGRDDLVTYQKDSYKLRFYYSGTDGTFEEEISFDGSGDLRLKPSKEIQLSHEKPSLSSNITHTNYSFNNLKPIDIIFGDINGDNYPDILLYFKTRENLPYYVDFLFVINGKSKSLSYHEEISESLASSFSNVVIHDESYFDNYFRVGVKLRDVNRDGFADLCYIQCNRCSSKKDFQYVDVNFSCPGEISYKPVVYLSNSGLSFDKTNYLTTEPEKHESIKTILFEDIYSTGEYKFTSSFENILTADIDGDGVKEILYNNNGDIEYLNPADLDVRPDLVTSVINPFSGSVSFNYSPTTAFQDNQLPFVIPVVSNVTLFNGINDKISYSYNYSGGYFDFVSKEFRGFKLITKNSPDGTIEKNYFHVKDEYLKGNMHLSQLFDSNQTMRIQKNFIYTKQSVDNTSAFFVKLDNIKIETYNESGNVNTVLYETFKYYDTTGLLKSMLSSPITGTYAKNISEKTECSRAYYKYSNYDANGWLWRLNKKYIYGIKKIDDNRLSSDL
jgi:hypothetical protein